MMAARRFLAVAAGVAALAACRGADEPDAAVPDRPPQSSMPAVPVAEPPLDRRGLLLVVAEIASRRAAGREDADLQQVLEGRRFEVRLRFGCRGDAGAERGWSFDEQTRVLRVRAAPEISLDDPAVAALLDSAPEGVEGFWIRRPWLLDAACPAAPARPAAGDEAPSEGASAEPVPAVPARAIPRIGVVQLFTDQDTRAHRRDDRPYAATVRLAEAERPSAAGYDLVLSGRLARLSDGRAIACRSEGPDQPPLCLVSAQFDRVLLATPAGETLAEWSPG